MPKILIIRFSSIGDIVLTTPIIRCVKNQLPNAQVHFLVKRGFESVISGSNYIDKVHLFDGNITDTIDVLTTESYDIVIDLQKNLKSKIITFRLGVPNYTFDKLNLQKWVLTTFKINILPDNHIVDRYFDGIKSIGITYDGKGLDFVVSDQDLAFIEQLIPHQKFSCLILGATHFTKRIPDEICQILINQSIDHVILLGGKDVSKLSAELHNLFPSKTTNLSGKLTLQQSAAIMKLSRHVITADTGMMHIAAALDSRIHILWGNTVPKFGMYPFFKTNGNGQYINHEVSGLSCRPCSKLGSSKCPKGHHRCMMDQELEDIK